MSAIQGLDCFLRQDLFDASSWGKMYKSSLFSSVRFPKGMIHEDIGTTYKTFLLSQTIVFIPDKLYFYFQRQGSLLHSKRSFNSYWNGIKLVEQQKNDVCKYYPNLLNAANNRCFSMYCYVYLNNFINGDQQLAEYSWKKIRELRCSILFNIKSRRKAKYAALASFAGQKVFCYLGSK